MSRLTAELLLAAAGAYGACGLAVGLLFLLRGLDRVDPAARGAHAFRPLLLPGLLLLWPLVLWRWRVLAR
ncbi:hypothetical protein [Paracraurococcus ruber]|uniref:Uncharacterized protein n=1 Tax=Paracraurococcus ruber TaxID=77675 RepID=A0ABS1D146_9PROT|nr:hypothetical protein [Paracraurococcus ruber]MBK1660216.1 hypothetical protein [Paracraurococcus ruber]TDG29672.1 hypothetical protein E2C05_17145 [Paracraurococcus ruber]